MGKPAVTGARDFVIDYAKREIRSRDGTILVNAGEIITIDGSSGVIYRNEVPLVSSTYNDDFLTVMDWTSKYKFLGVLANADTVSDAIHALSLGIHLKSSSNCSFEHIAILS